MVERVLVQAVGLVEQEDGMDAVTSEVVHVRGDGIKDGRRRRGGREPSTTQSWR